MLFFKRFKMNRLIKKLKWLSQHRSLNQPTPEQLKNEIDYYRKLAQIHLALIGHKKYPFARQMVQACYRAAAALEDVEAQFLVGKGLLEEARFLEDLDKSKVFATPVNARNMKQLYEEAHAYLQTAAKLNHIQAKRLLGLCYINGWGVSVDKKAGFSMVVESIDQEKSWDKIPQIFASIGLNKPEFFSALADFRHKDGE